MGFYEGVPLRDLIWLAKPVRNVRRIYYYGFHNDDPRQLFRSSLFNDGVLEGLPGLPPVIVCYKINGKWLTPELGGPVRIVVPEAYGNRSVKWLRTIVLGNYYKTNNTYAEWNNDAESSMKTMVPFLHVPQEAKAGRPIRIVGVAQVAISRLSRVQYWVHSKGKPLPSEGPYFRDAAWQDAKIVAAPRRLSASCRQTMAQPQRRRSTPKVASCDTGRCLSQMPTGRQR